MSSPEKVEIIAGLSIKAFLVTTIGILLFGIYVGILIYGENSLTVLNQLKEKKQGLVQEVKTLKNNNKKLQKEYFELKQLEHKG
jgi:cell division protein FtsB